MQQKTNTSNILDYLHTWNPGHEPNLVNVHLEDDIRDGLQGAYVRKPTLDEKKELLSLSARIGTQYMLLGFPAISQHEYDDCRALLQHIQASKLPINIAFLARTLITDLEPIVALKHEFPTIQIRADSFISTSPLRRKVEGWNFSDLLEKITEVGHYLERENVPFGLSLEDATRTPSADLIQAIDTALACNVKLLSICDTVGDSLPDGAARITEFFLEHLHKRGATTTILWHGHNDKGLGVANAIAAARSGAHVVSGTFLGLGERTGNTALEQVAVILAQAGNPHYDLSAIKPYCEKLSAYTHVPIAQTTPLVGQQAFTTATGTHSAAILKGRALGLPFEDYVFSSVAASDLGRSQELLISPVSGRANARYMLEQLGITPQDHLVDGLLAYTKSRDRWLTRADILTYLETSSVGS